MRYSRLVGNYFIALAAISVLSIVASVFLAYWTDSFHLDLTFFVWFLLGTGLRGRKRSARLWGIGVSLLCVGASALLLVLGPIAGRGQAHLFGMTFGPTSPWYYAISGLLLVTFLVPGVLLLSRKAREEFMARDAEP
jgi:hypothetical protein